MPTIPLCERSRQNSEKCRMSGTAKTQKRSRHQQHNTVLRCPEDHTWHTDHRTISTVERWWIYTTHGQDRDPTLMGRPFWQCTKSPLTYKRGRDSSATSGEDEHVSWWSTHCSWGGEGHNSTFKWQSGCLKAGGHQDQWDIWNKLCRGSPAGI